MGHSRGYNTGSLINIQMHRFDTKQLVVNMKVEILTVDINEFCSRFLAKRNQYYLEARLTFPLYRPTEDICIGIYVFKRVFNVWHMLNKVYQCNSILNNL